MPVVIIWPHYWPRQYLNATTENGAFYVSESAQPGTYAHEFGHSLGLPDLYPPDTGKPDIVGFWFLMDSGDKLGNRTSPSGLDAWSLIQLGWIEPTEVSLTPQV